MNYMEAREVIAKWFSGIKQLPTLPVVYYKLDEALKDPETSAQDIAKIVEKDQSLTLKILKVVNSAFYGFPSKIIHISNAVVILGFREVQNLALAISILDMFEESEGGKGLDYKKFWGEALRTSIIASILAKKQKSLSHVQPETAFVAALLQDIGLLILDQYKHENFVKIVGFAEQKELLWHVVEEKAMGFTHQEVGEYVLEQWKLPNLLIKVVGFHHEPVKRIYEKEEFGLISVVYVSHLLGYALEEGVDSLAPEFVEECWKEVGLEASEIESVLNEASDLYEGMAAVLFE